MIIREPAYGEEVFSRGLESKKVIWIGDVVNGGRTVCKRVVHDLASGRTYTTFEGEFQPKITHCETCGQEIPHG